MEQGGTILKIKILGASPLAYAPLSFHSSEVFLQRVSNNNAPRGGVLNPSYAIRCLKSLTISKGVIDLYKSKVIQNSLTGKDYLQREDVSRPSIICNNLNPLLS
jgi:hypothetical protein